MIPVARGWDERMMKDDSRKGITCVCLFLHSHLTFLSFLPDWHCVLLLLPERETKSNLTWHNRSLFYSLLLSHLRQGFVLLNSLVSSSLPLFLSPLNSFFPDSESPVIATCELNYKENEPHECNHWSHKTWKRETFCEGTSLERLKRQTSIV